MFTYRSCYHCVDHLGNHKMLSPSMPRAVLLKTVIPVSVCLRVKHPVKCSDVCHGSQHVLSEKQTSGTSTFVVLTPLACPIFRLCCFSPQAHAAAVPAVWEVPKPPGTAAVGWRDWVWQDYGVPALLNASRTKVRSVFVEGFGVFFMFGETGGGVGTQRAPLALSSCCRIRGSSCTGFALLLDACGTEQRIPTLFVVYTAGRCVTPEYSVVASRSFGLTVGS